MSRPEEVQGLPHARRGPSRRVRLWRTVVGLTILLVTAVAGARFVSGRRAGDAGGELGDLPPGVRATAGATGEAPTGGPGTPGTRGGSAAVWPPVLGRQP